MERLIQAAAQRAQAVTFDHRSGIDRARRERQSQADPFVHFCCLKRERAVRLTRGSHSDACNNYTSDVMSCLAAAWCAASNARHSAHNLELSALSAFHRADARY